MGQYNLIEYADFEDANGGTEVDDVMARGLYDGDTTTSCITITPGVPSVTVGSPALYSTYYMPYVNNCTHLMYYTALAVRGVADYGINTLSELSINVYDFADPSETSGTIKVKLFRRSSTGLAAPNTAYWMTLTSETEKTVVRGANYFDLSGITVQDGDYIGWYTEDVKLYRCDDASNYGADYAASGDISGQTAFDIDGSQGEGQSVWKYSTGAGSWDKCPLAIRLTSLTHPDSIKLKIDLTDQYQVANVYYYTDDQDLDDNLLIGSSLDGDNYLWHSYSLYTPAGSLTPKGVYFTLNNAPRYFKIEHSANYKTGSVNIKEFVVENDDTVVDFKPPDSKNTTSTPTYTQGLIFGTDTTLGGTDITDGPIVNNLPDGYNSWGSSQLFEDYPSWYIAIDTTQAVTVQNPNDGGYLYGISFRAKFPLPRSLTVFGVRVLSGSVGAENCRFRIVGVSTTSDTLSTGASTERVVARLTTPIRLKSGDYVGFHTGPSSSFELARTDSEGGHIYGPADSITFEEGAAFDAYGAGWEYKNVRLAMESYNEGLTEFAYIWDAQVGTTGQPEDIKIYNSGTAEATAYINILDTGSEADNLILISSDDSTYYNKFQTETVPVTLASISPGQYKTLYAKTDIDSAPDTVITGQIKVKWRVTI